MQIEEYSYSMEVDESGIERMSDAEAIQERIREWLATPEGTVADLPGWGHRLSQLKFEPSGSDQDVLAEMLISEKLAIDVKDMVLRGVLVDFKEIDLMYLIIDFGIGVYEGEVTL